MPGLPSCLTTHRKRDSNRGVHFDWIAVEQGGLITPLFHGVQSRLYQQRVTGHHFKLSYLAVLVDNRVKDDVSLNARLASKSGIQWPRLRDDGCRRHVTALLDAGGSCRLRRRWKRGAATAADDALSGNAAEHATRIAV